MSGLIPITPLDSVVPVYLDSNPLPPIDPIDMTPTFDAELAAAVQQFIGMGLTEGAARAVARYDGPLTSP